MQWRCLSQLSQEADFGHHGGGDWTLVPVGAGAQLTATANWKLICVNFLAFFVGWWTVHKGGGRNKVSQQLPPAPPWLKYRHCP